METKLLTKRAHIVANNLFFENSIIVSFTNYAWGIWVLWNSHQISLDPSHKSEYPCIGDA